VHRFVAKYNGQIKKSVRIIPDEVMGILKSYSFPGNVRELENLVERGVMLARTETLPVEGFAELLWEPGTVAADHAADNLDFNEARDKALAAFERSFLLRQIELHKGNLSELSQTHHIPRPTLYRLLSKHGIDAARYRKSGD
jgi:DNA-binding NtrC family response regulator